MMAWQVDISISMGDLEIPAIIAVLQDVVSASDANDGDSLANAIQAARDTINKSRENRAKRQIKTT